MSNDNALTTVAGTRLEAYGEREQVGEIVDRLMKLHPQAGEVGLEGMRAAAQLAVMVGASPLPSTNEIHVWRQGQRVFVDLGINYFRRMRDELGGVLWEIQPRQMREEERAEHGIPQGQLAALCRGIKVEDMIRFKKMGFTTNEVWRMSASTGVGVCGPNEAKNGRPAIWTAFKRAEKDLYRQLFPVMMNMAGSRVHTDEAVVIFEDRVDHVRVGERPPADVPEAIKDMSLDEVNELLFDAAVEGEYAEVEEIDYDAPIIDEETGEILDSEAAEEEPIDWYKETLKAADLDEWSYRAFQTPEGKLWFEKSSRVKKWYAAVCGEFNPKRNEAALGAFRNYANSMADGVKTPVKAAKAHFKAMLELDGIDEEE